MATPGGPRPGGFPPNYNPDSLASNIQNLNINQPNQQQWSNAGGSSAPRTPNASPFGQPPPPFAAGQSRPPPPGVFPRGWAPNMDPGRSTSSLPDVMSARPTGPTPVSQPRPTGPMPVSQPPPFASRPPPPGVLPSSMGRPSAPPNAGAGFRPQMKANGNGPPSYIPGGVVAPPPMGGGPRPSVGLAQPPTMMPSSQPLQTRPEFGSPHAAASSSAGPPFSAHPQGPQFSGPPQSMPPPPGSLPFPPPPQGAVPSSGNLYGTQTWLQNPPQVTF